MGLLLRSSPLRWSTEGEGEGGNVSEGGTKLHITHYMFQLLAHNKYFGITVPWTENHRRQTMQNRSGGTDEEAQSESEGTEWCIIT